jgi:hypothetical protein
MTPLDAAILRALAYADVFDFALSVPELHRYLVAERAAVADVSAALSGLGDRVTTRAGLVVLAGREALLAGRAARRRSSARLWPAAVRHARAIAALPFVRMVAITGALAVGNALDGDDVDLLVVTAPGRVWLTRASSILLVRAAARSGTDLCPNYFLAESALSQGDRDLFTAHELAQMIPVAGEAVYRRLRATNAWVTAHLPNAQGAPACPPVPPPPLRRARPLAELALRGPVGEAAERWERRRKVARFQAVAEARGAAGEAAFGPDRCKGHLDGHAVRIRAAYEARIGSLGVDPCWRLDG